MLVEVYEALSLFENVIDMIFLQFYSLYNPSIILNFGFFGLTVYILIVFLFCSKVLEDHRNTCEIEGKYVEAEMAKNRVAELKLQDYNRRYEELIFNQT